MSKLSETILPFITKTFTTAHKEKAVVAVSGGIDSAVALTLSTIALSPDSVYALLLPYGDQSIEDSLTICEWNKIPETNRIIIDIKPLVDLFCEQLGIPADDKIRQGNIMARVRMICVYDLAKEIDGLVIGTENKSEYYLGYFTRYGDQACDVDVIAHLYKRQVRALARELGIPEHFIEKVPSAGLWQGQTDEGEFGFTYSQADQVIAEYLGEKEKDEAIPNEVRTKILTHIASRHFKHEVPYSLSKAK